MAPFSSGPSRFGTSPARTVVQAAAISSTAAPGRVPVSRSGRVERLTCAVLETHEFGRCGLRERVGGNGQGGRLDIAAAGGEELAVARSERLELGGSVHVELFDHETAGHRAECAVERLVDLLDRDFLEDEAWDVLGPVDVSDLRVGGHDHGCGSVLARDPGAVRVGDGAVFEVEDVLAEVPHGAAVVLCVEVVRDLVEATVEIGDVLGDQSLDSAPLPLDEPRFGEERDFGSERLPVDPPEQQHRLLARDREEGVRDVGGIREGGRLEIDPLTRRGDGQALHVWLGDRLRDEGACRRRCGRRRRSAFVAAPGQRKRPECDCRRECCRCSCVLSHDVSFVSLIGLLESDARERELARGEFTMRRP